MRVHLLGVVAIALVQSSIATANTTNPESTTELFFPSNGALLDAADHRELDAIADRAQIVRHVVIDGHADQRGASAHNVGLALRRAEAAKEYLITRGVDRDSVVIVTFGEDAPRRSKLAHDRRVSISLTDDPLHLIVDRSLPLATAMMWGKPATTAEIEGPAQE